MGPSLEDLIRGLEETIREIRIHFSTSRAVSIALTQLETGVLWLRKALAD